MDSAWPSPSLAQRSAHQHQRRPARAHLEAHDVVAVPRVRARVEELQHANLHPSLVVVGCLVLHYLRRRAAAASEQAVSVASLTMLYRCSSTYAVDVTLAVLLPVLLA